MVNKPPQRSLEPFQNQGEPHTHKTTERWACTCVIKVNDTCSSSCRWRGDGFVCKLRRLMGAGSRRHANWRSFIVLIASLAALPARARAAFTPSVKFEDFSPVTAFPNRSAHWLCP